MRKGLSLLAVVMSAVSCGSDGIQVFSFDQCRSVGGNLSCASEGTEQCSFGTYTFYDVNFDHCPIEETAKSSIEPGYY